MDEHGVTLCARRERDPEWEYNASHEYIWYSQMNRLQLITSPRWNANTLNHYSKTVDTSEAVNKIRPIIFVNR